MTKPNSHELGPASNLGELKAAIERAIELYGSDCDWNGYDDESIIIYPPAHLIDQEWFGPYRGYVWISHAKPE